MDPNEEHLTVQSNQITGAVLSSKETLRRVDCFDPDRIAKIYQTYRGTLKPTASIFSFQWFQRKEKKKPLAFVQVSILRGQVKVHHRLPLEAYPPILDHFSTIFFENPTYQYEAPLPKKRKLEVDHKEDFEKYHLSRVDLGALSQKPTYKWLEPHNKALKKYKEEKYEAKEILIEP